MPYFSTQNNENSGPEKKNTKRTYFVILRWKGYIDIFNCELLTFFSTKEKYKELMVIKHK